MKPLIFSLFKHPLAIAISSQLKFSIGKFTIHDFPDGETYLRLNESVKHKNIIIVDSLNAPNLKLLPLLFFAKTVKEMGAKSIGLVAPYLAYLRHDERFQKGEAVTSRYFSELLSNYFDWVFTIDPHLHRYHNLNEIYSIPNKVIHSTSALSQWIKKNVPKPMLIGPDIESKQWVSNLANDIAVPYLILEKIRLSDKQVEIVLPDISRYLNYTPVLIDDIISTGQTMIEAIKHLKNANMRPAICIGIHAIFSGNSYQQLLEANTSEVITCNTIPHISNQIDISTLLSMELTKFLIDLENSTRL